jgi:hypothetical protein
MNIIKWTYKGIKKIIIFLWNNLPNIIALTALYISIKAMNNANYQFKENSISSDSLFNVQLKNERILNDSLVRQIKELQIITSKQLELSKQSLTDYIEARRARLYIGNTKITQKDSINKYQYQIKINTVFFNTGDREAININYRIAILDAKKNVLTHTQSHLATIAPGTDGGIYITSIISPTNLRKFYLYLFYSYSDSQIDTTYKNKHFMQYSEEVNVFSRILDTKIQYELQDKVNGIIQFKR